MTIQWPEGIDESRFLAEYWQQKPLLIKSAFENFQNPIDPNELAGISCEDDANSRFIEHTGNNEWRMCAGPLDNDFFDDVTGNQWSLLVSDVEKLLPEFGSYLEPFRFLPDWRIDDLMISYAPVGGSVGAHVDQYDVFLLQADGVREWQIENTPRHGVQPSISNAIALLGDFVADETWQLHPGDMLYLPPQYAHHGIAKDEPCMTWSIGFRAPSIDEMLPDISNYLLDSAQSDNRFSDASRSATDKPGLISSEDMQSLRHMLKQCLQKDDDLLDQWIGRFLTEPKESADRENSVESNTDLYNGTIACDLKLNSQKRVAYTINSNGATLFADGKAYFCSESFAQMICNQRICTADTIAAITDSDQKVLHSLIQQQVVLPEHDDQPD